MSEGHESVDLASRNRRGQNWQPPRAWSSPTLERTLPGKASVVPLASCSPLATTRPSSGYPVSKRSKLPCSADGTLHERSDKSAERYKDENWRLKVEVADRREETKQLQQRVRLLEGSLQVRMGQLETLIEELRNTPALNAGLSADRRLPELLDRIIHEARRTQVVLHVHADAGAHLEAKDRLLEQAQQDLQKQDILQEKLADSEHESRRLAAKVRESDHSSLRQRLDQVRRSARKQDELLAEYECSHRDLSLHVQRLTTELEEERKSRREQELTVRRLTAMLTEALPSRSPASRAASCEATEAPSPAMMSRSSALRLEYERLCDDERAQRRQRRRMQVRQVPGTYRQGASEAQYVQVDDRGAAEQAPAMPSTVAQGNVQDDGCRSTATAADDARALGTAISRADQACRAEAAAERDAAEARAESESLRLESAALRDELQAALNQAARAEAARAELEGDREQCTTQVERELRQHAAIAERRAWTLTEVAHEVVLQADLRELRMLQDEVDMQKAMNTAEHRCSVLEEILSQTLAQQVLPR